MEAGEVVLTRDVFINTEASQNNGDLYNIVMPTNAFSCKNNQKMRLTLTSFEMRKNWYEINNTNNTFFLYVKSVVSTPFSIVNVNIVNKTLTVNGRVAIGDMFTINGAIPNVTFPTSAFYFVSTFSSFANNQSTFQFSNVQNGQPITMVGTTGAVNVPFSQIQSTVSLAPCIIPPGTYRSFAPPVASGTAISTVPPVASSPPSVYPYSKSDLATAIKFAVDKALSALQKGGTLTDWANQNASNINYTAKSYWATGSNGMGDVNWGCSVTWNTVTRQFSIALPTTATPAANETFSFAFIFPQLKTQFSNITPQVSMYFSNTNPSVYGDWTFQDSHQVLGARPALDSSVNVDPSLPPQAIAMNQFNGLQGLTPTFANSTYVSPYVGQLNTIAALYLRIFGIQTANYQAPTIDRNMLNLGQVEPTPIFARIPLVSTVYDDLNEMISWTDSSVREHRVDIDATQMSTLQFTLTDDKSRPIPRVSANQGIDGMQHYRFTLKFEIIQKDEKANIIPSSIDVIKSVTPVGYTGAISDDRTITDRDIKWNSKVAGEFFKPTISGHRQKPAM